MKTKLAIRTDHDCSLCTFWKLCTIPASSRIALGFNKCIAGLQWLAFCVFLQAIEHTCWLLVFAFQVAAGQGTNKIPTSVKFSDQLVRHAQQGPYYKCKTDGRLQRVTHTGFHVRYRVAQFQEVLSCLWPCGPCGPCQVFAEGANCRSTSTSTLSSLFSPFLEAN